MRLPSKTKNLDVDAIMAKIASGVSQTEIADEEKMSVATLNTWLHADAERSARAKEAMEQSAESWLDRGLKTLREAPPDNAEIARARAIEQHCARRAAIRNPRHYGEKLELSGNPDAPLQVTVQRLTEKAK
jgi:transcriptional regulator with XRE-family HTH domain